MKTRKIGAAHSRTRVRDLSAFAESRNSRFPDTKRARNKLHESRRRCLFRIPAEVLPRRIRGTLARDNLHRAGETPRTMGAGCRKVARRDVSREIISRDHRAIFRDVFGPPSHFALCRAARGTQVNSDPQVRRVYVAGIFFAFNK